MIITATQLEIKSIPGFFRFVTRVGKIRDQLNKAEGLVFVRLSGLRTLTGWENREAMISFRNNGYHLEAMRSLKCIGKAKSISWEAQSEPDWQEAKERLNDIQF